MRKFSGFSPLLESSENQNLKVNFSPRSSPSFSPNPFSLYIWGYLLQELAHKIMEAKKSHDLAVCKLEIQEGWWCNSVIQCNSGKMDILARESANSPFFQLSVIVRPSGNWLLPAHTGEGDLLYSVYWF